MTFRLRGTDVPSGLMRGPAGKFTRYVAPSTKTIAGAAAQQGTTVNRMLREANTPDRLVGSGAPKVAASRIDRASGMTSPVYPPSLPWPEANTAAWSPHNVQKKPMRLR
jgi:hypothetical protein